MKSKKILSLLFFLVILMVLSFFFQKYSFYGNKSENIEINGNKFKVEIVNSSKKLSKGLGERDALCEKCGMLFEFQEKKRHSFWMKGMRFGLDIIWIDGSKIVYIARNIPYDSSETFTPGFESDKVLEINAGSVDKYGIKTGDRILSD